VAYRFLLLVAPGLPLYADDGVFMAPNGGSAVGKASVQQFTLGAGARYWSMWTSESLPSIFNVPSHGTNVNRTETAGLFVQGSYKFGESCGGEPLK
jgi:hypothetical protein